MISQLAVDKIFDVNFEKVEVERAIQFREILVELGPTFIKVGQAISIRPDILPLGVMVELQKLCD